jgi:hypothetical protein
MKQLDLSELSQAEKDERLTAAVTSYGVDTRSYNRSAEKREMDRQREEATARYESGPRVETVVGPICNCLSFRLPHELRVHRTLRDERDWRPWEERYVLDAQYNCYVLKVQRHQEQVK